MPFPLEGFPDSSVGKESACNARDPGSIPGLGRSPGEGIGLPTPVFLGFCCGSAGKESACSVGDGLQGDDLQGDDPWRRIAAHSSYSSLENSMDCIVHIVAKNQTRLSNLHFTSFLNILGCYKSCLGAD